MMDLFLHLVHFCASCVSDSNALPPAAGLMGGAAGAAGALGGLTGLQGSSDNPGIPPDGPIVPPVNAQPGQNANHGSGPAAAPTPSDPENPFPESINPDGSQGVRIPQPDGSTDFVGTDRFGNPTSATIYPNGVTTSVTSGMQGITNSTIYPGGLTTSTTVSGSSITQSTIYPGGAGKFVTTGNGSVTTGEILPDGSKVGITTEGDGTTHGSVTPPMPP